jgi:glutathione reductase (NADPH)
MNQSFDLIVVGGGSGGIATARRAAEYGARVALVEAGRLGGTCVNVGCVPKKLMWSAAEFVGAITDARGYGFDVHSAGHDWAALKAARDAYVARLNGIYEANLAKSKVEVVRGWGRLRDAHTVEVDGRRLNGARILLAPGGRPRRPGVPGAELGIDSDGFFDLAQRPERVTVVGAGYIGLECWLVAAHCCADSTPCWWRPHRKGWSPPAPP